LAGFGPRDESFSGALADELRVPVAGFEETLPATSLGSGAKDLIRQDLDALVGWTLNAGA
jgi:hypothetical protein